MMNIYTHQFYSQCPTNGSVIHFTLTIRTSSMIHVEHIVARCAIHKMSFHEKIADDIASAFPGYHILSAHHHGVDITTERAGTDSGCPTKGEVL